MNPLPGSGLHANRERGRFFSLREVNEAIRELTERLKDRVTRHLGASRRQLFEEVERGALKPLPKTPYEFSEWRPTHLPQLVKADLLIPDDWGPERLTANQRRDMMEIVEDRYGVASTVITSQLPVEAVNAVLNFPKSGEVKFPTSQFR